MKFPITQFRSWKTYDMALSKCSVPKFETITHLSDTRMYFFFFMEGNSNKNKMNNLRLFLYDIDSKIIIQRNQNFVYWWTWQQHEKHLIIYGRIYNYKPYLKIRIWELNICSMPCHKSFMTVCQALATGRWFSPDPPVSFTNKTDRHNTTEILLKVVISTIILILKLSCASPMEHQSN
jgi:hypothetical protein